MGVVTIKLNKEIAEEVIKYYAAFERENTNEYMVFNAKVDDLVISLFKNNKDTTIKAVFLGSGALKEAKKFDKTASEIKQDKAKAKECKHWICLLDQIGSDEVGTGDFFGPICVAGALVKESDIDELISLGVKDSKKLSDDDIMEIAPILLAKYDYSQLSVPNEKYNELAAKGMNMNEIKAKLHNSVLLNLKKRNKNIKNIFIDQFVSEELYYIYNKDSKETLKGITFRMKGESAYPSVAVGSIIARYSFLSKMKKLEEKYGMEIPFGAGEKVDEFALKFVEKFGLDELKKVVKMNFKNYDKLIEKIDKLSLF